ncbi:hypothetical protein FB451DRAFT_1131487 [Mycena latifolia]|nr:hypothetical protein FB451DRAFT_1131487 [Mycena latifolia]
MSFALNGTHIDGSTFNNVSGNMSQVLNSHVHLNAMPENPRGGNGVNLLHSAPANRSIGPIRAQRLARNVQPYAITDRSSRHRDHQMELPSENRIPRMIGYDIGSYGVAGDISQFAPPMGSNANGESYNPTNTSNISYNSVGGNMTQLSVTSYGESGIDILYRCVVMEALHDSGERFTEPACHPGTRTAVLEELKSWSLDTSPDSTILWLHGCAGMGKSAIAQMFAGECKAQGLLGASFFFKRGHPKRGTWNGLFTSLAYQLAMSVPELLLPVQQAVDTNKLVVGSAMTVQFRNLFAEPLRHTACLQFMPVIVLDGLDECADHKVQQQILRLFIDVIHNHHLPIRLLIASRPEPHIREILETEETSVICRHSHLSADNSAIQIYFRDEFSRIRTEYMAR